MGRVPWHLRRMDDVFGKEYGERSLGKYPWTLQPAQGKFSGRFRRDWKKAVVYLDYIHSLISFFFFLEVPDCYKSTATKYGCLLSGNGPFNWFILITASAGRVKFWYFRHHPPSLQRYSLRLLWALTVFLLFGMKMAMSYSAYQIPQRKQSKLSAYTKASSGSIVSYFATWWTLELKPKLEVAIL